MVCTISSKGQVVIPVEIRRRYKLKGRMRVEFVDTGHGIMIVPEVNKKDAFEKSFGMLKGVMTMDEFLKDRREERRKEDEHYAKKFGIRP